MSAFIAIILLAGLTAAEPAADHSADVMALAPAQADVFVYVDAQSLVPPAWRYVRDELGKEPFVAGVPELSRELERGLEEVERGLAEIKSTTGLDPIQGFHRAALWVEIRSLDANGEPDDLSLLLAVWGDFPADGLERLAASAGWTSNTDASGQVLYQLESGPDVFAAQLDKNTVIVGTTDLVTPRAGGAFKAPTPKKGTPLALHQTRLAAGAVAMLAVSPGKPLQALATEAAGRSTSARDMLTGFDSLAVTLYANGVDVDLQATSTDMAERYLLLSQGLVDLLEAGRSGTRGLARALLATLTPGDPELDAKLAPLLESPDAILDFVERLTGTQALAVTDRSDTKQKSVALEIRATHVREIVLPLTVGIGMLALM